MIEPQPEVEIHLQTLTRFWFGDIGRSSPKAKEWGLARSLRAWHECILRGTGDAKGIETSFRSSWSMRAKSQIHLLAMPQTRLLPAPALLGIPSRYELDGFLKEHRIEKYTADDFEHDLATLGEGPDRSA